jgi:hypothetical protein
MPTTTASVPERERAETKATFVPLNPVDNGCSNVLNGIPGIFNFRVPCANHDLCYYQAPAGRTDAGRKSCDRHFWLDMYAHCQTRPLLVRGDCMAFANDYYLGVRAAGGLFFFGKPPAAPIAPKISLSPGCTPAASICVVDLSFRDWSGDEDYFVMEGTQINRVDVYAAPRNGVGTVVSKPNAGVIGKGLKFCVVFRAVRDGIRSAPGNSVWWNQRCAVVPPGTTSLQTTLN